MLVLLLNGYERNSTAIAKERFLALSGELVHQTKCERVLVAEGLASRFDASMRKSQLVDVVTVETWIDERQNPFANLREVCLEFSI